MEGVNHFGDISSDHKLKNYGLILADQGTFEVWNGSDWLKINLPILDINHFRGH